MGTYGLPQFEKTLGSVYIHPQVIFDHTLSLTLCLFTMFHILLLPWKFYWDRLVVTDVAQCGTWNIWLSANKRSRNAIISHSENPSNSDAVQFFHHMLSTDAYNQFNMQA